MPLSNRTAFTEMDSRDVRNEVEQFIRLHRYQQALALIEKTLATPESADTPWLQLQQGSLLMAVGRKREALAAFLAMSRSCERREILRAVGPKLYGLARELELLDSTLQQIQDHYEADRTNLNAALLLADFYAYAQMKAEERDLRQAIAQSHHDTENMEKLIACLCSMQDFESAASQTQALAEMDAANRTRHLVEAASLYAKAKDRSNAIHCCDAILALQETDAQVLLRLGKLFDEMGLTERALAAFQAGSQSSEQRFRAERCALEACRMKIKIGQFDQECRLFIEKLSNSAEAASVRKDALHLLTTLNQRGQ